MVQQKIGGAIVGTPIGYVGSHVDDLLIVAGKKMNKAIREALSAAFPIDKWELDHLDYIGSEIYCDGEEVTVKQKKYAETRLFNLEIPKGADDEDPVGHELRADNQSLIGALSWLSAQTRPDLTQCQLGAATPEIAVRSRREVHEPDCASCRSLQGHGATLQVHTGGPARHRGLPRRGVG